MQQLQQKACFFICLTLLTSCVCHKDLTASKAALVKYYTSGQYESDVHRATRPAEKYLATRAASGATNLAIVMDIDDTALSDWNYLQKFDLGFERNSFNDWVAHSDAPAIKPVLQLYERAKQLGLKVYFLTGREEWQRAATIKNLTAVGYTDPDGLYMRPTNVARMSTTAFKASVRQQLAKDNICIIANISDQQCDFKGGGAERNFKVPNPFYTLP